MTKNPTLEALQRLKRRIQQQARWLETCDDASLPARNPRRKYVAGMAHGLRLAEQFLGEEILRAKK